MSESEINFNFKKSIKIIPYLNYLKYQYIVFLLNWVTIAKYVIVKQYYMLTES